jgi:micrococcal nuclease
MKKLLLLTLLILISSCTYTGQTTLEEKQLEGPYLVTKVIDGDTADIIINGKTERLRFSGVNTPETDECYYQEAKDKLKELILDKEIYIQQDKTDRGKYGRLLRYIYTDDLLVNQYLVENGYAKTYHKYKDDTSKYELLARSEAEAIRLNLGLWKNC